MFSPPFRAPFPSPIASPGTVVEPWYLAGGVAAANCAVAYQPIGAASLAASYANLSNPGTYDAAPGVAPTWASASGWTFDGTTQYLLVGAGVYVLSGSVEQTIIMRMNMTSGATRGLFSEGAAGASELIFIESNREFKRRSTTTSLARSLPTGSNSVIAVVFAAGAMTVYENGVSVATGAGHSGAFSPSVGPTRIGGVFQGTGAGTTYMAGPVAAVALYRAALTPSQIAAVSSVAAALTG